MSTLKNISLSLDRIDDAAGRPHASHNEPLSAEQQILLHDRADDIAHGKIGVAKKRLDVLSRQLEMSLEVERMRFDNNCKARTHEMALMKQRGAQRDTEHQHKREMMQGQWKARPDERKFELQMEMSRVESEKIRLMHEEKKWEHELAMASTEVNRAQDEIGVQTDASAGSDEDEVEDFSGV